jgi:hypothetical protein
VAALIALTLTIRKLPELLRRGFGFKPKAIAADKDANGEDEGYSRLPLDQLVETLAAQAKALGLHIDLSYKFHDPGRFGGTVEPKLIEGTVKGSEEKKR